MYFPCFECLNRYNREYTEECDEICMYAKAIKEKKEIIKYLKTTKESFKVVLGKDKYMGSKQFEYFMDFLIEKAQKF